MKLADAAILCTVATVLSGPWLLSTFTDYEVSKHGIERKPDAPRVDLPKPSEWEKYRKGKLCLQSRKVGENGQIRIWHPASSGKCLIDDAPEYKDMLAVDFILPQEIIGPTREYINIPSDFVGPLE